MTGRLQHPDAAALSARYAEADAAHDQALAQLRVDFPEPYRDLKGERLAAYREAFDAISALDAARAAVARQLLVEHLLPATAEVDGTFVTLLERHTGQSAQDALAALTWASGDHGGWCALSALHRGVWLRVTDSEPSYPRLEEFGIELGLIGDSDREGPGPYSVAFAEGAFHLDQKNNAETLLRIAPLDSWVD